MGGKYNGMIITLATIMKSKERQTGQGQEESGSSVGLRWLEMFFLLWFCWILAVALRIYSGPHTGSHWTTRSPSFLFILF